MQQASNVPLCVACMTKCHFYAKFECEWVCDLAGRMSYTRHFWCLQHLVMLSFTRSKWIRWTVLCSCCSGAITVSLQRRLCQHLRLVCQSSLPFTVSSFLCLKWPSGGRAQQTLLSRDCCHFQRIPCPWFYPHCHGLMLAVMMRCCEACSFRVLTAGMRTDTVAARCQHFMQHTLVWILMPCCYATWDTKTNCTSLLIIYW